ncbi:MAG TPA: hypothetical protein DEB09_00135 [Candidatus Magasanikbacteria bacterium]|nr:hypothetical protein [Candidatus Magasanikbacteria bacterium]
MSEEHPSIEFQPFVYDERKEARQRKLEETLIRDHKEEVEEILKSFLNDLKTVCDIPLRIRIYVNNVEILAKDDDRLLAGIIWKIEYSDGLVMPAGELFVDPEIKGGDIGYKLLCVKRELGKLAGYKRMQLAVWNPKYIDKILARPEEVKYNWKKLTKDEHKFAQTLYESDIL